MIGNGAKATTTTTGTGSVTLSAVTGYPQFSDVFAVGDIISYFIQDGNNWEWGYGTLASSSSLARTYVEATYASGTFTRAPGTGLTLSGNPATVGATLIESDKSIGMRPGTPSDVMHQMWSGGGDFSTAQAVTANYIAVTALCIPHAKYSGMKCNVTVAGGASQTGRLGVYRMDTGLAPANGFANAALIAEGNATIDLSTTGAKSVTFASPVFLGGWVFAAYIGSANATLAAIAGAQYGGLSQVQSLASARANYGLQINTTTTYGANMPSTLPAPSGSWSGYGGGHVFSFTKA